MRNWVACFVNAFLLSIVFSTMFLVESGRSEFYFGDIVLTSGQLRWIATIATGLLVARAIHFYYGCEKVHSVITKFFNF